MATTAEMLAKVDEAIDKMISGEFAEWSILGRTFRRHQISELWALRKDLQTQLNGETNKGARARLGTFGR